MDIKYTNFYELIDRNINHIFEIKKKYLELLKQLTIIEDISNEISITNEGNDNIFTCNIPEPIQKSSMLNIYWFIDNNEVVLNRNKTSLYIILDIFYLLQGYFLLSNNNVENSFH